MSFLGTQDRYGSRRGHLRLLRGGHRPLHEGGTPESQSSEHRASEDEALEIRASEGHALTRERRAARERAAAKASARILVAGADPAQRASVLRELSEALPANTRFGEAGAAWEVLDQASSSGVVMLAGDLAEVTAESLMHVLGHRHPSLPVVVLGSAADRGEAGGARTPRAAAAAG